MKNRFLVIFLFIALTSQARERVEVLPFGDMESWTVRYIKESALIGGKTKTMYMLAEPDTIHGLSLIHI